MVITLKAAFIHNLFSYKGQIRLANISLEIILFSVYSEIACSKYLCVLVLFIIFKFNKKKWSQEYVEREVYVSDPSHILFMQSRLIHQLKRKHHPL